MKINKLEILKNLHELTRIRIIVEEIAPDPVLLIDLNGENTPQSISGLGNIDTLIGECII